MGASTAGARCLRSDRRGGVGPAAHTPGRALCIRGARAVAMNDIWRFGYRMASWACTGVAWVNAAIVLWDGCTGHLQMQYRIVSLLVALLFGSIGGFVLGLERLLGKILSLYPAHPAARPRVELAGSWRSLHALLIVAVVFILVVMVGGLVAMGSRLDQGFKIFG